MQNAYYDHHSPKKGQNTDREYLCEINECIDLSKLCDRHFDCSDKSMMRNVAIVSNVDRVFCAYVSMCCYTLHEIF